MKKSLTVAAALFAAFTLFASEKSSEAIKTLLNTRASGSPKVYEEAAKTVAADAAEGKLLQQFIVAVFSREKDAPRAFRIDEETRTKYLDASRDKIRALAERRNNPLAYYLLSLETNDFDLLKKAADAGNVQAMNAYATISLAQVMGGSHVSSNTIAKAMQASYGYFKRAADQGDANGLYNLGMCYMRGYSVEPDAARAKECFLAAAKLNHPEAINNIGGFYRDGIEMERSPERAAHWFAMSADLGNSYGELNYALALLRGDGVVKDEERAVRMLKSSAQKGNVDAMNAWAECLHIGRGTAKDVGAAVRLYRKAADRGLAAAMDNYADCYERGDGLPRNQEAANIWRMRARAARGDRNAAAWLRAQSGK